MIEVSIIGMGLTDEQVVGVPHFIMEKQKLKFAVPADRAMGFLPTFQLLEK